MSVSLAVKLAIEYRRLLQEGWEPDLDEFLSRVPREHRAECRKQIGRLMPPPETPAEAEPADEPAVEAGIEIAGEPERPDVAAHEVDDVEELLEPAEVDEPSEAAPAAAHAAPPSLLRAADELRHLSEEIAHDARTSVDECVHDLSGAVVRPQGRPSQVETADFSEEEPAASDAADEPEVTTEADVTVEPEADVEKPPAPKGPQRLTKEEAMALWDEQVARLS